MVAGEEPFSETSETSHSQLLLVFISLKLINQITTFQTGRSRPAFVASDRSFADSNKIN